MIFTVSYMKERIKGEITRELCADSGSERCLSTHVPFHCGGLDTEELTYIPVPRYLLVGLFQAILARNDRIPREAGIYGDPAHFVPPRSDRMVAGHQY